MNSDTLHLLSQCSAGIEMGVASIGDVLPSVSDENLKNILKQSKERHEQLSLETNSMLDQDCEKPKEPKPIAKSMSWMKTNVKLALDRSDAVVADLITDGCNMGIKTLHRYVNEYNTADEKAVDIASRLIGIEEELADQMHPFL